MFKQKTAYMVRISDWSSDVCSSDLRMACEGGDVCLTSRGSSKPHEDVARCPVFRERNSGRMPIRAIDEYPSFLIEIVINLQRHGNSCGHATEGHLRSEEHTSELKSPMRISYAVFC